MKSRTASALLIAAALAAACGRSLTGGVDGDGEPPPPIRTTLPTLEFTVAPGGSARLDFEVGEPGSLVATIDWTASENNLVAVITGRGCQSVNDALAGRCRNSEVSGSASTCPAKPRLVAHTNYAPVALRLWIANTGARADSGHVAMTHCRDAPDCGATGSCTQCLVDAQRRRSCAP